MIRFLMICIVACAWMFVPFAAADEPADEPAGSDESDRLFPVGDLFEPLVADSKQPAFYMSFYSLSWDLENTTVGAVGFGETIGIYRWADPGDRNGFQFSMSAGVFAQFDMETNSMDVVNADFVVGPALSFREGIFSARARLYHQSSHVGDEYLINNKNAVRDRLNYSYESIELLGALDIGDFRPYAGGEYVVRRDPNDLDRRSMQFGIDYRSEEKILLDGRLVGGFDFQTFEQHDWNPSGSLKVGLAYGERGCGNRNVRFMLEAYRGYMPFGQNYNLDVYWFGFGVYLGF